jgi:dCMP deaminase
MSSDVAQPPDLSRRRASRPELFMNIAELYAGRSSCLRANVGAVAIREGRIVATGYVGAPSGMPHCLEVGCEVGPDGGCTRSVHAEANLVAWSARTGTSLQDTEIYCTHMPCLACAKLLANSGIASFTYQLVYRDQSGYKLLFHMGVKLHRYESPS